MGQSSISYLDSGVSIEEGDRFVDYIKQKNQSRFGGNVVSGIGGFSAIYKVTEDKFLAAGTDGVGTKLKLAVMLGIHNTIGIDLVAMNANDIICSGATPSFFMDYLAYSKLEQTILHEIIDGICEGCNQSEMALIGGETAQMPEMYEEGDYDLAGFAVGEVKSDELIDGTKVTAGYRIIGVASSGVHSNGFSLVRKLVGSDERDLLKEFLTPTTIYVSMVKSLLKICRENIAGIAHITGGGFTNIARINSNYDYVITPPNFDEIPRVFTTLAKRSNLCQAELYKTFNMGVGLVLVVNDATKVMKELKNLGVKHWDLGEVKKGHGNITIGTTLLQ